MTRRIVLPLLALALVVAACESTPTNSPAPAGARHDEGAPLPPDGRGGGLPVGGG